MNNSTKLLLELPSSLRESLESLAQAEGTSPEDLLVLAIAEKLARTEHSAWLTQQSSLDTSGRLRELMRERSKQTDTVPVLTSSDDSRVAAPHTGLQDDEGQELRVLAELFQDVPVFIAVLEGPDHAFRMVNESHGELVGHRDVIGKRVVDCVPEVAGTHWIEMLDHVYRTGEPRVERGARLSLAPAEGEPVADKYVDYAYKARRDANGTITGIIALGVDTSLVQKVTQSADATVFLLDKW